MTRVRFGAWGAALLLALGVGCTAETASFSSAASGGDSDGDGDPDGSDCAPLDPMIHAGATETCNQVDDDCDGLVDEPVGMTYCVPTTPRPTASEQCLANLMVGQLGLTGTSCPPPSGGWTVRPLFTRGFTGPGDQGFCIYEHPAQSPDPSGLPTSDDGRPAPAWLFPDCPVLVPLGGTDAETASEVVFAEYRDGWLAQLEAEPTLPTTVSAVDGALPGAAHVAVLDSAPPNPGYMSEAASDRGGTSRHGAAMGLLIEQLACPAGRGGTCVADFTNHIALGHKRDRSEDTVEGGEIGTFSQAAIALEEALTDGASARIGLPTIVALSIGAEPGFESLSGGGARPAAAALRFALDKAACQQALVFASAGNRTGGPGGSSGPTIPGAWASEASSCGPPLVYAVGAVDPTDQPLQRARVGGTPELVAPGRSVVVDLNHGFSPLAPTPLMSGTSFGPVAAAAAAAVIWSYAPGLTATDVAGLLYDSATPLSHLGAADFCAPGASCRTVRRLSMCGALLAARDHVCALDSHATICTFSCTASRIAAGAGSGVALSSATRSMLPPGSPPVSAAGLLTAMVDSPMCGGGGVEADLSSLPMHPDLCPYEQYPSPGAGPVLGPQPLGTGCRLCAVDVFGDKLTMYVVEEFGGGDLYPPILETSEGDKIYLSSVISGPLSLGEEYEIEDLGIDPDSEWATLTFLVVDGGDKYSVMEEIELW